MEIVDTLFCHCYVKRFYDYMTDQIQHYWMSTQSKYIEISYLQYWLLNSD